jgi:alpha-tubulin suppressor-like RCC1 family protein
MKKARLLAVVLGGTSALLTLTWALASPGLVRRVVLAAGYHHAVALRDDGLWSWGDDTQPTRVADAAPFVSVAAGRSHTATLAPDGKVWLSGSLRATHEVAVWQSQVATMVIGLAPVTAIASGGDHLLLLKADGTVSTLGANGAGQLGDDTMHSRGVPALVKGLAGVRAIAGGGAHSLALRDDGTVTGWGANSYGQIGESAGSGTATPIAIAGLTDIVAIAAGSRHSLAVGRDGSVWALGDNREGQLGTAWGQGSAIPVRVDGLPEIVAVAAGEGHSLALGRDGSLWGWGRSVEGQLGTVAESSPPTRFSAPDGVVAIAAGGRQSLAATADGAVWSWGGRHRGEPHGGPLLPAGRVPIPRPGGGSVATPTFNPGAGTYGSVQSVVVTCATSGATIHYTTNGVDPTEADPVVASGGSVNVNITLTLKAKAWKSGLTPSGVATAVYTLKPATPTFTPAGGTYTSAQSVTIATTTTGAEVRYTTDGTEPTATSSLYAAPLSVTLTTTLKAKAFKTGWTPSDTGTATYTINYGAVSAGLAHSVVLKPDGTVYAWGDNTYGQMGNGVSGGVQLMPVQVAGLTGIKAIAAGGHHTLVVKSDNTVWGWGRNTSGQLGDRSFTNRSTPVQAWQLTGVIAIAAGETHSLALKSDNTVYVWGGNGNGQLGLNDQNNRDQPAKITSLTGILAIAAGWNHSLAFPSTGVRAWGSNSHGQIGNGTSGGNQLTPVQVSGPLTGVKALAAGGTHSLAVLTDGTARAWGRNDLGQLGNGNNTNQPSPVTVSGLTTVVALDGGLDHSLASRTDGTALSWGANGSGQLGDGSTTPRNAPWQLAGLANMVGLSAGGSHSLGLDQAGVVWAWGGNSSGQLGDGTQANRLSPVSISEAGFAWKVATPVLSIPSGQYQSALNVTVTCATSGVTIHYTTTGVDPTEADPVVTSGSTVPVGVSLTLKAKAWKTGMPPSNVAAASYTLLVPPPTLNPGPNTYFTPQNVTITSISGAVIHYTTNGIDDPTEADPVPPGGIVAVNVSLTLKAKAWKAGWATSATTTAIYTMKVGTPTFAPGGGSYGAAQSVQVSTVTPAAEIHYTTSGVEPTTNDPVIASGVTVNVDRSMTLKARAWKTGWTTSDPASATYLLSLGTVATPTMSPPGATYPSVQTITLASATTGATIRYTTDGTEPGWFSPAYAAPFQMSANLTVKAKAFKADFTPSGTASASYVIDTGAVATPRLSPGTGVYTRAKTVTVTCDTPAATIHYTTNGADPTEADLVITSGSTLPVNSSMMLKAKAWKPGQPESGVARGDYSITGAVAAGANHTLALKPDGTVWAWGYNGYGQLGNNSNTSSSSPVQVTGLSDVVAIAAGALHSLAVKADGTVLSWGYNFNGQLGNNSTTDSWVPVQVQNLTGSPVVAVAADRYNSNFYSFSLALKADGTVWGWGSNLSGQLGSGAGSPQLTPVQVVGITGVTRISVGSAHSLALKTDGAAAGTVWAWGFNGGGQLGDGTVTNRATPVSGLTGAVGLGGGLFHSMAVKQDGSVFAWGGDTASGLLGDGSPGLSLSPVQTGVLTKMRGVAGGSYHSVAVREDGSVWFWGRYGGYDPDIQRLLPIPKTGVASIAAVATGGNHSVVLGFDGSVWTWGENLSGEVGDSTSGNFRTTPFKVPNFGAATNWPGSDPDADGLATFQELELGTDPMNPDTNGDGISDGDALKMGISPTNLDLDGDGVSNVIERQRGTDPFLVDTDGDGVADGTDCFPLDPARATCPAPTPGDTTPPVITLAEPTNAALISSVPPP